MNIIVCIKQVPESAKVGLKKDTLSINRQSGKSIMNPYDRVAIETAIRLKEKYGGKVIAISMGPDSAKKVLKEAIAMGVEEGILLSDKEFIGSDTWATAYSLASLIKGIGKFDLVICGKQAIDGDTGQVGPQISSNLNIPQVTYVNNILEVRNKSLLLQRKSYCGYDEIQVSMPTLITVEKDIYTPRYKMLKNVLMAETVDIKVYNLKDIGISKSKVGIHGSPTSVCNIYEPEFKNNCEIINRGSKEDDVRYIVEKLKLFGVL